MQAKHIAISACMLIGLNNKNELWEVYVKHLCIIRPIRSLITTLAESK